MIPYLLDTSVIVEFYRPKTDFRRVRDLRRSRDLCAAVLAQKLKGQAVLFVPSFCVTEVKNTFGKWFFRKKVFGSRRGFDTCTGMFTDHVANREFYYTYELNPYHILSFDDVFPVEHTTETEYQVTGLKPGADETEIEEELVRRNPHDHIGRHYLGTFDMLILSMGIELRRMLGREVYLLTNDRRLALIAGQREGTFPRPLLWNGLRPSALDKLA